MDESGVSVLLADDHPVFRAGMVSLIKGIARYRIVAEVADGSEALRLCRELHPHIAVLDIALPGLTGLDVARQLRDERAGIRVLVLSAHCDEDYVRQALRVDVAGYVSKDATVDELEVALRAIERGATFLSPTVSHRIADAYMRQTSESPPDLTARQRDVARLIAEGLSTKEVAFRLALSVKTIETHRAQLMRKLGVNSVAGLIRYAVRMGLVSP